MLNGTQSDYALSSPLQLSDGFTVFSLQNRLQESMRLFSAICNNVFFRSTSMVRNPISRLPPQEERSSQTNTNVNVKEFRGLFQGSLCQRMAAVMSVFP